jgi:hypothetical protein
MRVEVTDLVGCLDWAIGRFMPRNVAPSPTYLEDALHDGLEELGIGLKLRKGLDFLRSPDSRQA